jgi:hypothetical protein
VAASRRESVVCRAWIRRAAGCRTSRERGSSGWWGA